MLADLVVDTLRSLRAHALRFVLTGAGIAWGTAMLTVLVASTEGYDRHFAAQVEKIGPRIVYLFPGVVVKERVGERGARPVELELEDSAHVAALDSVEHAAPNLWAGLLMHRHGPRTKLLWSYGVTPETAAIRNFEIADGRFVSQRDLDTAARVVFLGHKAAQRLFGSGRAVGESVHIEGLPFRVIGVGREKGEQIVNMGPRDDELSLIPVTTVQRRITRDDRTGVMILAPTTRDRGDEAIRGAREVLGLRHGFSPDDDRAVGRFDVREALGLIEGVGIGLHVFLTAAGLITLLVGAIGVMNIMLVVVHERRREVGLRKAIGASERAIFVQFLAETLAITSAAGLVGGAVGWLAVRGLAAATPKGSAMVFTPYLDAVTVAAIALVLAGVGVVAGVVPAQRAARIDPAISLRSV